MLDISDPTSDDWMAVRLATELGGRFPRLSTIRRYKNGDAPVQDEASEAMNESYRMFARRARLHVTDLIVDSKVSRQSVLGFRTAAAGDANGDELAEENWRRSRMDLQLRTLLSDAAHYGEAYIISTGSTVPNPDVIGYTKPMMLVASPWNVIARPHPMFPWMNEYAVQVSRDEIAQRDMLTLYGPGWFRVASREAKINTIGNGPHAWSPGTNWDWDGPRVSLGFTDKCPVVTYSTEDHLGVYEKHLDTIDRIITGIKDRMTLIAMQAFRQRAVKGDLPSVYPAEHPLAGERVNYDEIFKAGPAAIWRIPFESEIWESTPVDITPLLSASKDDFKNLAAATATALYLLSPELAGGSAEGASLAKESMIFSVEELNRQLGAALSLVQGLQFEALGDLERADPARIEVMFGPIDRIDIVQRSASAAQAKAGGMSQKFIMRKVFNLTPAEIAQEEQDRSDEVMAEQAAAEAEAQAQADREAAAAKLAADAANNDPDPKAASKRGVTSDPAKQ